MIFREKNFFCFKLFTNNRSQVLRFSILIFIYFKHPRKFHHNFCQTPRKHSINYFRDKKRENTFITYIPPLEQYINISLIKKKLLKTHDNATPSNTKHANLMSDKFYEMKSFLCGNYNGH
jgi:hypothetical protein